MPPGKRRDGELVLLTLDFLLGHLILGDQLLLFCHSAGQPASHFLLGTFSKR